MNWGKGIEEVQVSGEKLYLKKGIFGWSVVHPIMTDGKVNYKNLIIGGSWATFFFYVVIMIVTLLAVNEYSTTTKMLQECLASPIKLLLP